MIILTPLGFSFFGLAGFLGLFYSLRNRLKEDGYLFLYFLMMLLSYELFYKTLIHSKIIYSLPELYISGRFFNLLVYPVLLLFVFSVTKANFRLQTKHWLLIIFSFSFFVINYFSSLGFSNADKIKNLNLFYADTRPGAYNYWGNWVTLLKGTIIPLIFVGISFLEFYRFRRQNPDSTKSTLLNILLTILILFFLYNSFSNFVYKWMEILTGWSLIEWPVDIFFLSVILAFLSGIALLVNSGATFLPPSKYASSSLTEEGYKELVEQANQLISEDELFKDPEFSLQKLSKLNKVNPGYMSQAINHYLGIRFNDYINKFRINEAKKELLQKKNEHLTIDAIAMLCGFNSKSTFFRVFKKTTGLTPKQFADSKK